MEDSEKSVDLSSLCRGTISTRPEAIMPLACTPLFVKSVPRQDWERVASDVARNVFGGDGGVQRDGNESCIATVVKASSLLYRIMLQEGSHATLIIIAHEDDLREQFNQKLKYADERCFIKSIEQNCLEPKVSDPKFQDLLLSHTRHEQGDRDTAGKCKDGAVLLSSQSGTVLAASATLHVWPTEKTIPNTGSRHTTCVGVVDHFTKISKPCVGLLLSESGSLKILSTQMLRNNEPVLQVCRPGVNSQLHNLSAHLSESLSDNPETPPDLLPHSNSQDSTVVPLSRHGSEDLEAVEMEEEPCALPLDESRRKVREWGLPALGLPFDQEHTEDQKDTSETAISQSVVPMTSVARRPSQGLFQAGDVREAFLAVRECFQQRQCKEADWRIKEFFIQRGGTREGEGADGILHLGFEMLCHGRFYYKGEHTQALQFLDGCSKRIADLGTVAERAPSPCGMGDLQLLQLWLHCWKGVSLRNLGRKGEPSRRVEYFRAAIEHAKQALKIYQAIEADDLIASEVHLLCGCLVNDILEHCEKGDKAVLLHELFGKGKYWGDEGWARVSEEQTRLGTSFCRRAEWADGTANNALAVLSARQKRCRGQGVKEYETLLNDIRSLDPWELQQQMGHITQRTKMRWVCSLLGATVQQLEEAESGQLQIPSSVFRQWKENECAQMDRVLKKVCPYSGEVSTALKDSGLEGAELLKRYESLKTSLLVSSPPPPSPYRETHTRVPVPSFPLPREIFVRRDQRVLPREAAFVQWPLLEALTNSSSSRCSDSEAPPDGSGRGVKRGVPEIVEGCRFGGLKRARVVEVDEDEEWGKGGGHSPADEKNFCSAQS